VLTAARLIRSPDVATAAADRLGATSRGEILRASSVTPVSQSNVISIKGEAPSPQRAADIANAFAEALIERQTTRFQSDLEGTIGRLRARLQSLPAEQRSTPEAFAYQQRLGELAGLVGTADPTLQVLSRAVPASAPVWPRPLLSVVLALMAALVLAIGVALLLELVSPRVTREDELLLQHRLPILARVPRIPGKVVRNYLTGRAPLPGDVRESYRTLRANLTRSDRGSGSEGLPQTLLVTSAVPGEGKTMTAVNLSITLALGGLRVILVDGDLRRPMVATRFGVAPRGAGFASVLDGSATVEEALVEAPGHGDSLRLLLSSPEHGYLIDLLEPRRVEEAMEALKLHADIVVLDSPPLTEVADALSLADEAEAVIVAVRLGHSRRDRLSELRRMLAQRGVSPAGFVVTTRRRRRGRGYHYGSNEPHELPSPRSVERDGRERVRSEWETLEPDVP
jgi:non-specific protein-tyrosine kinase